tara:strand:+ start:1155 stop:1382 length:228 start_codon:yes stop_codon:yes gene_type:complete
MDVMSITDGETETNGAFCPDKMAAAGVDSISLSTALANKLGPFTALLKDGYGFGAYVRGDNGSVIGFTAPETDEE